MPFTQQQFFEVFAAYNAAVWPGQIVWLCLALAAVVLAWRGGVLSDRLISAMLALLWAWMAVAYHYLFFAPINPAAYLFGLLFLIEAALLAYQGVAVDHLRFRLRADWQGAVGLLLILFALAGYPALAWLGGERYPAFPTFGLPCPGTIFTIGMLFLVRGRRPRFVLVVPVLWSAIGGSAAVLLDVRADTALLGAGLLALGLIVMPGPGAGQSDPGRESS
ncbi:MAG TPA: DUF6064 family protein [Gammaproteobacteria bacterium]|nr:DUF6064 family protein [Gammaproteobacteria bacterium]